jgi:hypothetical protein
MDASPARSGGAPGSREIDKQCEAIVKTPRRCAAIDLAWPLGVVPGHFPAVPVATEPSGTEACLSSRIGVWLVALAEWTCRWEVSMGGVDGKLRTMSDRDLKQELPAPRENHLKIGLKVPPGTLGAVAGSSFRGWQVQLGVRIVCAQFGR